MRKVFLSLSIVFLLTLTLPIAIHTEVQAACYDCSCGCSAGEQDRWGNWTCCTRCTACPTPTPTPACFRPGTKILIKKRPVVKVSFAEKAIKGLQDWFSEAGKKLEYSLSNFNLKLRNK